MLNLSEERRTHNCGELRRANAGQKVILKGWVASWRNHGGIYFVDLRDRYGITQVVFDERLGDNFDLISQVRNEYVLAIYGEVSDRGENINKKIPTGEIEVFALSFEILTRSEPIPFPIEDEVNTNEVTRLQYRYLDLRRKPLQDIMVLRHKVNQIVRNFLSENGFLEIETPYLNKSTPEGARDYLVPSRVQPGNFYALPQSPQIFKQILMVAGFDRYFQIVRCFRDEDLRQDRQPEFTQIDIELSFPDEETIYELVEGLLVKVWKETKGIDIPHPFPRITWNESMARFGVDNPDMRYGLELCTLNDVMAGCQFKAFASIVEAGGLVKAISVHDPEKTLSRSFIEKEYDPFVKVYGAKGLAWARTGSEGWQSPIAKFFDADAQKRINELAGAEAEDSVIFFVASENPRIVNSALGNLRKKLAAKMGLIKDNDYKFVWVTEFPLFEYSEEEKRWASAHHPFTQPRPEHMDMLQSDPGKVLARAYDIVLNGNEIGGGSIRIHSSEMQQKVFRALGIGDEEAREKFGFLLDALQYGAPPHGGLAFGMDRLIMLLAGTQSIRDVIAFPKTTSASCLMSNAPSRVDEAQLKELGLKLEKS